MVKNLAESTVLWEVDATHDETGYLAEKISNKVLKEWLGSS